MRIDDFLRYFNPFDSTFHAKEQFARLPVIQKICTIFATCVGSLFFGVGGLAAFRFCNKVFTKSSEKSARVAAEHFSQSTSVQNLLSKVKEGSVIFDCSQLQQFLLNDYFALNTKGQDEACDSFTQLFTKMNEARSTKFLSLWLQELKGRKRAVQQEIEAQNAHLSKIALQKRSVDPDRAQAAHKRAEELSSRCKEIGTMTPITKVVALSEFIGPGPRSEYKVQGRPPYQNISFMIKQYQLDDMVLIGARGDGHCALRGFILSALYNGAKEGGRDRVVEILKTLGKEHLAATLLSGPQENLHDTIFQNYSDPSSDCALELAIALRQAIAKQYKTAASDTELTRIKDSIALQKETFAPDAVTQEEIDAWLESFANPSDEELSLPFYHANDVDLCVLSKILKTDFIMYATGENLVQLDKRDETGARIIESEKQEDAFFTEQLPIKAIMKCDAQGNELTEKASKKVVRYKKESSPAASRTCYKQGMLTEGVVSQFAVCLFNRQGLHTDVLI